MFSRRGIKLFLIILFLFLAGQASSFNDTITHPTLARQSVELFNEFSGNKISSTAEINWIMQGAREEDTPPRWMNHFYNPQTGYGLSFHSSAKNWTGQNIKQSFYPKGNQTWQRAIDSYIKGDRKEAFIALGHNLHLIEDMAVPAHTRLDIHLSGDPFESWAENNSDWKLAKTSITKFNSLGEYFDSLANYSNRYFFSQDTIEVNSFYKEIIENKKIYLLSRDDAGEEFKLAEKVIIAGKPFYYLTLSVHSDYYSLLAPKAVSYGAGMIDLFFKEVEKKKEEEAKKNWLDKLKNAISNVYPKNIEISQYNSAYFEEAGRQFSEIIRESGELAVREAGQVLSVKITAEDLFKPEQIEASDNDSISVYLPSPEPSLDQKTAPLPFEKDEVILNKEKEKTEGKVLETGTASNSSGSASITFSNDNTAPETAIISSPEKISSSSFASFVFSSSESESSFEYNLNNNGWQSCGDRLDLTGLADGEHIIEIRASDKSGNTDKSPAVFSWVIDTASFVVNIANSPASFASSTGATFLFQSNKEGITYSCQLDNGGWELCQASTTISDLTEGEHGFSVKGFDAAGNISSSTVYSWFVDITAPVSTIKNLESEYSATGFTVEWGGSDIATTTGSGIASYDVQYKIESGDWQEWVVATSSAENIFGIAVEAGKNIYFRVRAYDKAGNMGEWSDEATTKVALPPTDHLVISEIQIAGATATDEFVELYNPTSNLINLNGYRLSRKTGGGNPFNLLTTFPNVNLPAKSFFLITHPSGYDGAVSADAVYSTTQSIAADNTVILYSDAGETVIDKVGFGSASDFETAAYPENPAADQSLERKAAFSATAATMGSGGEHEWQGNGYDSDNNSNDFIVRSIPQPQNSFSPTEPRNDEPIIPAEVDDLAVLAASSTASTIKFFWSSPANANLGSGAYYDLRYKLKAGDCDLETGWDNATKIATSSLPTPATSAGETEEYVVTGLAADTQYCFALMVYNGNYWSDLSNQASGSTLSGPAGDIIIGNISSLVSEWGTSTLSWLHTVGAGDEMIFLSAYWHDDNKDVINVSFGGENLTKIAGGSIPGARTNISTWFLINPPVGEHKVEVEFTYSMRMAAVVVNLGNVNTSDPISAVLHRNFQSEHVLDVVNAENNNSLIIDSASVDCGSGALIPDPGQTEIFNHRFSYFDGTHIGLSYKKTGSAGEYESGWTQTFNNNWTHSLAVITPKP
ncbi:MAG: lamin tail domain-containing protein [Patescibacteria group bacterium]|nr:lamin tail domain-containing protein [Patescibacteria group bacterium]